MFINLIKEMAGKNRMSQRELAFELGVSEKTINNKINGKTEFTLSEIVKICLLFPGKDIDYLFATDNSDAKTA